VTLDHSHFFSFCVLEDQSSCCLTHNNGTILAKDDEVCMRGICSFNGPNLTKSKIERQYLFCNIDLQDDEFCGPREIKIERLKEVREALRIFNDRDGNSTNNTNGTGGNTTIPDGNNQTN